MWWFLAKVELVVSGWRSKIGGCCGFCWQLIEFGGGDFVGGNVVVVVATMMG